MVSADVLQKSSLAVNQGSSWQFAFALTGIYDPGLFSIRVTFPEGFKTKSAVCEYEGTTTKIDTIILYNQRMIECNNIGKQLKGQQSVRIVNMINPNSQVPLVNFTVELLQQSNGVIIERISFDPKIQLSLTTGSMQASLAQDNNYKLSNMTLTFYANPTTLLGNNGGSLQIVFGKEWKLWAANCTLVKGFERETGQIPNCYLNSYNNTYNVNNFKDISYTEQIVLKVIAQSPLNEGSFPITIQTLSNSQQIVDVAVLQATTNSTFGSLKRFTAHAVRDAVKLKAGQAGPLESTFFLKHNLPATNYQSTGKIVLDIFPKIPKPSLNYGIVKCYFFGNILASNCDYDDNTYSDRTKVTIFTPENFDYQESEIPITITTEGSKPGFNDGIPLDPLVKRYLFHYHFYDNNIPTSEPTEVYYQEWIPDSFEIPDTDFKSIILIQEKNEYTHLRFEMKQQISLPYGDRNYLVRVTFVKDSGNAWEIGQSYTNNYEIIEDYPCLLYGSAVKATPASKCDLYQQTFRDPFVQAYGFETLDVDLNEWIILEVPQIKIRNVAVGTKATLRFSLMEETPGMINHEVELYYKIVTFNVLAQSFVNYSFNPNIATTLMPPTVDLNTDLRFQWSAAVQDPDYLIYEIDQVGYYDIGRKQILPADCDNNQCSAFQKFVQQVVVYPTTPLTSAIVTNVKNLMRNPGYQDTFVFKVRAMRNGVIVNKHTFNVRVGSADITNKIFDICNTAHVQNSINSLIRKNEEQEYYIKFTTQTQMPRDSLIRFAFKNIKTQVQVDRHINFCKIVSGLSPYNKTPVQCYVTNTAGFEVTHFEAVPAGTPIEIHFRLLNDAANVINPIVDIETFYGPANTQLIDNTYLVPCQTPNIPTNNVDSQIKFKVLEEAVRSEKREKGYIGPIIFDFSPNALTTLKVIKVKFDNAFKTPRNYGQDSLICLVNEVRFLCTYTINPMLVTIDMTTNTYVNQQVNRLSISTEYVSPYDGILHPMVQGFYPIHVELQDINGLLNQATRWIFIKADKFQYIVVRSVIRNQGRANMFQINLKTTQPLLKHSSGGRIHIEFPTLDPMGNPLFDLDLGGYSQSGDDVGCRFINVGISGDIGIINANRCRLIKSQSRGNPAIVEIINFPALPAGTEINMWIAKVFNPPNFNYPGQPTLQVMDANISVSMFEQNLSTGQLKYIQYDTYNVFLDIRDDPSLKDSIHPFSAQANNQVWEMSAKISATTKSMINQVWYDVSPFANEDFYIVELPNNFPDVFQPDWKMATCSTFYSWCLTFPQINWVVMRINVNLNANTMYANNDVYIQKLPQSISQVTTTYKAYVWQGALFRGYVIHQITPQQWLQLAGIIKNQKLVHIDSEKKLVKGRKRVEVNFNFTTTNFIPYYGAIQIRFPARIPSVQSHCRSAVTVGSGLLEKAGPYGGIGCLVQDKNTWVLYGFKDLNGLSNIKVSGTIDLPTDGVAGYIGDLDVITYGTHEYDNIFNVGRIIDKSLALPNSGFTIDNFDTKSIEDIQLLHIETKVLRNSWRGPLNFKFKVGTNIFANKGRIRMMFYQYSQLQFNDNRGNQFQFSPASQYVCNIQVVDTQEDYGCKMESVTLKNQGSNHIYYLFQMIPNSDLLSNTDYLFTLTTIDGNGQDEGLTFPNSGLPYKIDISMSVNEPSSSSDYTLHEHLYYQVYGVPFQYLKFTSYITLKNEMNLFIVEFQPGQVVRHDDVLVIEIPTASIDIQNYLFADDGGLNLNNMDIILHDIIDMSLSYPDPTMECRMSRGLQLKGLPLKFLCSNFKSSGTLRDIQANERLKVAFNIMNPDVTANHYSIPAQVYIQRNYQNANEKIIYDFVENAFYIHFWNPQIITAVNGDFNLGPVTTTVCNVNTDFKFRVRNTQNLVYKNDDAFILRFTFEMQDNDYLHKKTCNYVVTGNPQHECATLPNLKTMIVWPEQTNDLVSPQQVSTTGSKWRTSNYREQDNNKRMIVGYASYVRELWSEKIIYQDLYPDIQPQRVQNLYFDLRFKSNSYNHANERIDFIFEVTSPYWYYMDRVIILFPSNIGWLLIGDMCQESPNSDIQIIRCWFVNNAGTIEVWVDIAHRENYVKDDVNLRQTLLIESHMETFQVPDTANLNPSFSSFSVKLYTWSLLPQLQPPPWRAVPPVTLVPSTEKYTCLTDSGVMRAGEQFGVAPNYPWDVTWKSESTIEFDYEYHRYIDEFVPCFKTDRSPIRMEVIAPIAFASLKGTTNFHIFDFFYGTDILIPTPLEKKDYVQDKLICWMNNDRVKCINDDNYKKIRLYFQTPIAVSAVMMLFITSHDTNDITKEGFSYQGANGQYQWLYEMQSFGSPQVYYGYTDPFPIFYNTNGGIKCPHRGIEDGDLSERSTQISGKVTGYWFYYRFARPDILGITLNFHPRDYDNRLNYATSFFMDLDSGANYPCSRGLSGGKRNDVRCIYEKGDSNGYGSPHKIHVFDFNYQVGSNEVFGFLFQMVTMVFKITVEAWGGTATFNQPYGNLFMGSLIFNAWWGPYDGYCNGGCSNVDCDNSQRDCNYIGAAQMLPDRPAYMENNQIEFKNFCQATTQATMLLEVVLQRKLSWDSSYVEVCEIDPQVHVKDMFIYEKYDWNANPASNFYVKKAYLYYPFTDGPAATDPIIAYYSCGDLLNKGVPILMRFETITNTICEDRIGSVECSSTTAVTNEFKANQYTVDVDQFNNDLDYKTWQQGVQSWMTLALKLDHVHQNAFKTATYESVLTIAYPSLVNVPNYGIPFECYVVEGLRMSDRRKLGEEPFCAVQANPNNAGALAFQFKITNWDTIVQNEYVRILFRHTQQLQVYTVYDVSLWQSLWMNIYANNEAYNDGRNGHMNSRDIVSVHNFYFCSLSNTILQVTDFNHYGANTNLDIQAQTAGNIGFHYDNGSCAFTQCIEVTFFGLQDYAQGNTVTISWSVNGVPTNCQGWVNYRLKGLWRWTVCFDHQYNGCLPGGWNTSQTLTFNIVFMNELIRLDRNYWWVHFRFYEVIDYNWNGYSCPHAGWEFSCGNDEWINSFQVGNNLWVTPLSTTYNTITEIDFTIAGLYTAIGLDVNVNRILIMEFNGPQWNSNPIYFTQYDLQEVNCLCQVNGGAFTEAICVRRVRSVVSGRVYDPVIMFYISAPQGGTIRCSIPEIILPVQAGAPTPLNIFFKVIRPSLYEWFGKNGESFNSRIKSVYTFTPQPQTSTQDLSLLYNPSVFYQDRSTTELFVGYYDLQISNIRNLDQPYVYIRHADIGPLMTYEMCEDVGIWDPNFTKVYNKHTKVIICKRKSSLTSNAVIGAGKNLYFEQYKTQSTADYNYYVYVYKNFNLIQEQISAPIPNANFQPIKSSLFQIDHFFYSYKHSSDQVLIAIQVGLRGFLWRETRDGGRVEVYMLRSEIIGITPACTARIEKEFQHVLWCYVDNRNANYWVIVVHNLFTSFTTNSYLNIYFSMQNPTGGANRKIDYTVKFYYNYRSDADYKVELQDYFTQTGFDFAEYDLGRIRMTNAQSEFYGFRPKKFVNKRFELRLFAKVQSAKIWLERLDFITGETCMEGAYDPGCNTYLDVRVREYDLTLVNKYDEIEIRGRAPLGNGFLIHQPNYRVYTQNSRLEIIISSRRTNGHIGLWKQTNPYLFGHMFVYDSAQHYLTIQQNEHQSLTRYSDFSTDKQTDELRLEYFHFTNQIHKQPTSFMIAMFVKSGCTVDYPRAYFELKFPILAVANIPGATHGNSIQCQISLILEAQNPNRVNTAKCRVFDINSLMVRIEELNVFPANSVLTFAFDDWILPDATNTYIPIDIEFNFFIGFPGSIAYQFNRYFILLKEVILVDGMNPTIWNNLPIGAIQLNAPNSYVYGQKNVEYNGNKILTWPQASTGYYDLYGSLNTAGQKMRLIFTNGFIGGDNTPDSLTYYDGFGQLSLLWFNRKTRSAYISAPKQEPTGSVTFEIKNAVNPYPYQRDTWNANGLIDYQLYMGQYWNFDGDGFRQTNIGQMGLSLKAQWGQFIRELPTITIDTALTHQTDVVPDYKYAKGQTITMRFRITHSLSKADKQKRQITNVLFDFIQGVSSIKRCYIQSEAQNSNVFIHRYAECVIGFTNSRYQINLWNIAEWDDTKPYQMFVQMTTNVDTIIYQMSTVVKNGELEHYRQINVPMIQYSNTHFTYNSFRFTEGKYINSYYELGHRKVFANSAVNTIQRLRFRFTLDLTLSYIQTVNFVDPMTNADFIQIKFPPTLINAYIQTDPTQWLMCYFIPEISVYDKLGLALYSKCKLDTTGTPIFYKLTAPRDILQNSKVYVIHISEKRVSGASFSLPPAPVRSEFIFSCYSPISSLNPSYDTFITAITNRFSKAKINHLTTTSEDYDVAEITFVPTIPLVEMQETFLKIEIDSLYFQKIGLNYEDFDIINTYKKDALPEIINGNTHSYIIEPSFSTGFSIVNFGQHNNFFAKINILHVGGQDLNAGSEYVFKIPMVKNPKDEHISLSYKISTVKINKADMRQTTFDEYNFINHAYVHPLHTDMTAPNFQMNSVNDYVQQTTMDISVSFNYNIAAPQRILLKWNNNNNDLLNGIDRTQLMSITISGCKVEVFDTIYLIMITPQTYSSGPWSVMSLGTNFKSNDYSVLYGFWYVYITNKSLTQYYHNPAQKWLKPLEDLTPKSLIYKVGYQTINSVCLYRLTINTPQRIPMGGYIQINLSQELDSFEGQCYTYTVYYLVDSTNASQVKYGPLECQRKSSKAYIIKGFNSYTTVQTINVEFYLKNVNSGVNVNIDNVSVYGTQNPNNIIAISKPVPSTIVLSNNIGMNTFDILDRVTYPVYAGEWQKLDFIFTQRSNDLLINQNFQLRLTLPLGWDRAIGTRIQFKGRYKRNDPKSTPFDTYPSPPTIYKDWTTSKFSQIGNQLVFDINVDDPLLAHYSIPQQVEYLFSIDSERADTAFQEGLYNVDRGLYNFYLESYSNGGATLLERTYNEFYVKPREDTADSFRVSVLNTAAGEKTVIRFTFTMNYSKAQAGDEIHIQFQTFDRLYNVFKNDLGLTFADISSAISCSEKTGFSKIQANRLKCYVFKGSQSTKNPRGTTVTIKIPIEKDIANTEQIDFWIAYIENPVMIGQVSGIKLSIRRDCRDDSPHFHCILYHAEHQYRTSNPIPLSSYATAGTFTANSNVVTLSATHTFTITPTANIASNQYILIQYPSNHKNQNTCTSLVGECIEFPEYNWVLFKPGATLKAGLDSSIELNNMINGFHRRNDSPNNYFLLQVFDNTGYITQPYKITHNYYDHYMIGTVGTIINTQTYDPQYHIKTVFLKENHMNVAQVDVLNMDIESEIEYFRLEKPKQVSKFDPNYCNATLSLLPLTARKPYPLRYDCEIFTEYILLTRTKYFQDWDNTFKTFNLRIYFKFIIDDKIPPLDGVLPGAADPFLLYGCVYKCNDVAVQTNNKEYSHVTKSIIPWDISFYQQPNLNTAGFYTESYYQREAHINEKVSLQMLIQPNTNSAKCDIDRFVFTVPDEFIYPSVKSLDKCTIQGAKAVPVDSCSLTRRQGLTQITLTIKEKLGDLAKIITISDSNGDNLFVAPPYPGTFYPIKLEMFCGSQLVETQYTNFTNVKGENLDVTYIKVLNSLDELTPQLYEFQFKTGKYATPLGYQRTIQGTLSTDVYTNINIVFEWIGDGYTIHPGYASDLGIGKPDNQEVGCTVKAGLIINPGNRLICIVHYGTGPEQMPMISISGYEQIPTNTVVQILITNIQSIAKLLYTTVKIGVELYNPTFNNKAYFYNLVAYVPDVTTVLNTITTSTSTVVVTGNKQIHGTSNYEFTFTTSTRPVKLTDYIGFAFPDNFINTVQTDMSQISCSSTCSKIFVFPASSMVYVQPKVLLSASTSVKIMLSGIPNPNYAIQGNLNIKVFTFIDRKLDRYYNAGFLANFLPSSQFTSALVEAASQTGGEPYVQYTFYFILGHLVPPNGSITIDFPKELYSDPSSMAQPLKCKLKGDVFDDEFNQSVCKFAAPNRLSIILSNTQLSPTTQYTVFLDGITNPNIDMNTVLNSNFVFSSHFNSNPMLNQIIAQKTAPPPIFYLTSQKKCSIVVTPALRNINIKTFYSFKFVCKTIIKDKSDIMIKLPAEYRIQNQGGIYQCSSYEQTTLFSQDCNLSEVKGDWILNAKLRNINEGQTFTVNVELKNPSIASNSYAFSATFLSYSYLYAVTDNSLTNYAPIYDNSNIIYAKNLPNNIQIKLQNLPINAALPAFYIFQTPNVNKLNNVLETSIKFPVQFAKNLGDNLKCFIYQSNNSTFRFTIHDMLKLRAHKTIDAKYFQSLPCSLSYDYTISITGITQLYKESTMSWNYLIVQNVNNPGQFYLDSYMITHSNAGMAQWIFEGQLYYEITEIAKQLDIKNITAKINSTTVASPYIFETSMISQIKKNIQAGIMIDLPDQFDISQQLESISCYSSISLDIQTNCQLYNNTLLSWKDSLSSVLDLYQYLYVQSLINPTISDPCANTATILNPYFTVSIVDLTSNQILATSVEIERPANVLKLVPQYNDLEFELTPNVFIFKDYDMPSIIKFTIQVKQKAKLGMNSIKFLKYETREGQFSKAGDQYQLPPILTFEVTESTNDSNIPYIYVQDFRTYSVGGLTTAFIDIPTPPAQNIYINIDTTNSKNIIIKPTRMVITSETKRLNFTVQYTADSITSPIPFYFSLSSNTPIIHQLKPPTKYLVITQSNVHPGENVAKLDFVDNLPTENFYINDIGKPINKTLLSTPTIRPEILEIKQMEIKENSARLNIITSQQCTVKYILTYKNSKKPVQNTQIFASTYQASKIISEGQGQSQQYFLEGQDYSTEILIEGLTHSTSYDIHAICFNGLGISEIKSDSLRSAYVKSGAAFHITLNQYSDPNTLIDQLSQAMRIPKSDMTIITAPQLLNDQKNRTENDLFSYEIAIAPKTNGYDINQYLNSIISSTPTNTNTTNTNSTSTDNINNSIRFEKLMRNYVTGYQTYRVQPFSRKFINGGTSIKSITPRIDDVSFYSAQISVSAWQDSLIYGIVQEVFEYTDTSNNTQTIIAQNIISQQVILGYDQNNNPVDEYWQAQAFSNSSNSNIATLQFDNLKDGTSYILYITATNIMPYPLALRYMPLPDDQVLTFNFTTPFNYNTDHCLLLDEVRGLNKKLSELIESRFETEKESGYCKKVKNIKNVTYGIFN